MRGQRSCLATPGTSPIKKMNLHQEDTVETPYKVVILGGGSAGWMTAAYLSKTFERGVDISVVESSNIGTVGVGEATFSDIHLFFEYLGLAEEDWMPHCNASYKLAIRFVGWNAERRDFYHPFQKFGLVQGRRTVEWWLKLKKDTVAADYACFTVPAMCNAKRSPRYLDGTVFDSKVDGYLGNQRMPDRALLLEDLQVQYPYAYHFDANLLGKFMSGYAQKRHVRQILDDVVDVKLKENGEIRALVTKEHGEIEGDLFVDCTGFRGLLINKVLEEPFISFSESLPCDSAVAMQIPAKPEEEGMNPYTTASALSAGWVWDIPLYHRTGTGYVYSSAFTSAEAAEREFRAHLGKRAEGCKALHIKMRVGRNRNSWVKNCVAIGLSSAFVEPLESTGIFFIQHGIEHLVTYFPGKTIDPESVKSYNKAIGDLVDGIREFLTIHYVAGSRNDSDFWKATKNDLVISESLAARLKLWKQRLPTNRTINQNYHGFQSMSYSVMLLGLGHCPDRNLAALDHMPDSHAFEAFDQIKKRSQHLIHSLPSQYEYLTSRYKGEMAMAQVTAS